jgi:hypothetical protein
MVAECEAGWRCRTAAATAEEALACVDGAGSLVKMLVAGVQMNGIASM